MIRFLETDLPHSSVGSNISAYKVCDCLGHFIDVSDTVGALGLPLNLLKKIKVDSA